MPAREPRLDPRPGDVLTFGIGKATYKVEAVYRFHVEYREWTARAATNLTYMEKLSRWRRDMAAAVVVSVGEAGS